MLFLDEQRMLVRTRNGFVWSGTSTLLGSQSVLIQKEPEVLSCALNVFLILSMWEFPSWLTLPSPLALFPFSFCVVVFPLCHASGSNLGLWDFTYFVLHVWVFCLNVWLYHGCTVPTEARRGLPVLWVWNYRWLWTAMWIMRIKPRSLQEQPVP